MKVSHSPLSFAPDLEYISDAPPEKLLFFDIETTGLSWRSSHLCLIGMICMTAETWQLTQIFLESPLEEEKALHMFLSEIRSRSLLIHYNGNAFDIPYLAGKCSFYGLDAPFDTKKSLDLYQRLRTFRRLLPLASMKQKDMESLIGYSRSDHLKSSQIGNCYRQYLLYKDTEALNLLLLHNRDDLEGMTAIVPLLAMENFFSRSHEVSLFSESETEVTFAITDKPDVPVPLSFSSGRFSLKSRKDQVLLTVTCVSENLKLFFPNYRDYYYLPDEDMAVHKSVGQFVERSHRKKATPSTCYQKKKDIFLPVPPGFALLPLFAACYGDREQFCLKKELIGKISLWGEYVSQILNYLLRI
ncbi:MAG: ribonuclease H-like domain-containing protein [Ruminococcus sp.]|jgi:uncharacterized protein YprB with RNaseH-like and TPR domain